MAACCDNDVKLTLLHLIYHGCEYKNTMKYRLEAPFSSGKRINSPSTPFVSPVPGNAGSHARVTQRTRLSQYGQC